MGDIDSGNLSPERFGPAWIQTNSGGRMYAAAPEPKDFSLRDISAGLAKVCRYAGQCDKFYSVAEHSILVAKLVQHRTADYPAKRQRDFILAALMHDASEAYLGDIPTPFKKMKQFEGYVQLERDVMLAICKRFGIEPGLMATDIITNADRDAVGIEVAQNFKNRELIYWGKFPVPSVPASVAALHFYPPPAVSHIFRDVIIEVLGFDPDQ